MKRILSFLLLLPLGLVGCGISLEQSATLTASAYATTPTPEIPLSPTITNTPYPTPDLSRRPLTWFAPLPPLSEGEGRPFIGAEDFMELFEADAPWNQAASHIDVFKVYGEWLGTDPWNIHASDEELHQVVANLNQRSIAIAIEAGPLEATSTCGQEIEGFGGGTRIGIRDARRIKAQGGTLSFIALDEPFAHASLYEGVNACQWTAEQVAREVGAYIQGVRTVFPDLLVGDTEPLWKWVDVQAYKDWLTTFRSVNGYDLAFFHLDVDFGRDDWPQAALEMETFSRALGINFGIIYTGNWNSSSDEAWLTVAGERVKTYELVAGGRPDHILFQSWQDHPDRSLPETEPNTFTGFINAYFNDKAALGVRTKGPGANLAYHKPVTASRSDQFPPERAVDGDSDTTWGAGDFSPQWIEIDLGEAYTLAELRLLTAQDPGGVTTHRILVKGTQAGDHFIELHTFSGVTADQQWLPFTFPETLGLVRYVRIETLSSPSWVAWREIEIIAVE